MESEKKIKILKGCGWGVLILVLLFTIIAAVVSPIGKYIVNNYGDDIIGRQLHAERVRVNIFNGNVTVSGFHCRELSGETDFFYINHIEVGIAYPRLLQRYVKIKRLHLDGFNGQILQTKDQLNFSDLIERFAKDSAEVEPEDSPWRVTLKDIQLSNSAIRYRDVIHDKQWKIEHINLAIPGLTFENENTNAGLDFSLPTGGKVMVDAKYRASSNSLHVGLKLHEVHTDVLLPLVQDYINVSTLGAHVNAQLQLVVHVDNIQNVSVKGSMEMKDLLVKNYYRDEVAKLDELRVVMNRCDLSSRSFILDSLVINGLSGRYEVHKNWNTLSRLLKTDEVQAKEAKKGNVKKNKSQQNPKPIVWMAKSAVLNAHDMVYYDDSKKSKWTYAIKSLRAEGKNVASNGRNSLRIDATLTHNAKMKADFVGGLDVKRQDTRFNVTLSNVNLKDFSPLCRNYTGYPIEAGILYAETHIDFSSGKLTGNTRLVIDDPTIGKKEKLSKAPYRNLPVRSTFQKLVDSENRVNINAVVSADATKKNFSFKKVFVKSLLKETFGRMMATKSKKDKISDEERQAIEDLIGVEENSEKKPDEKKTVEQKPKKEKKQSLRDRRRNGRNKKR